VGEPGGESSEARAGRQTKTEEKKTQTATTPAASTSINHQSNFIYKILFIH